MQMGRFPNTTLAVEQPHSCHQPAHPKYTPLGMAVFTSGFPETRPGPPSKSKQCCLTRVRQSSGSRFAVGKPCSQPRPRHYRAELTMRRTCAAELQGRPRPPGRPASQVLNSRVKAAEPSASRSCTTWSPAPQCAVGKTWHTLLPDVWGNKQQLLRAALQRTRSLLPRPKPWTTFAFQHTGFGSLRSSGP
jgi:hypothetical protein